MKAVLHPNEDKKPGEEKENGKSGADLSVILLDLDQ